MLPRAWNPLPAGNVYIDPIHDHIVEKMDFVDDKIFFGIEKIGFVTEMI